MQCVRCGCEKFTVLRTERNKTINKKTSVLSDSRDCVCNECALMYPIQSNMEYVYVYDKKTMKKIIVDLETYKRDYLPFDGNHRKDKHHE
jgi:hypothetical protein